MEPIAGTPWFSIRWNLLLTMALEGSGKVHSPEASRTIIYVSQRVASDSAFPFKPGDELTVRIEGKRLVIEKA